MRGYDVVIIGDGILGLSTAFALAQQEPSLTIGIIGSPELIGNGSIAAGAMLGCFGEVTQSTFRSEFGLAKLNMAIEAKNMWPSWLELINSYLNKEEKLKINLGTFIILNAVSGQLDSKNYSAIIKALNDYKEPYSEINPSDIPGINPVDNCRPLRALHIPNESAINSVHLVNAFKTIANKLNNITLIKGVVGKIYTVAGKVEAVEIVTKELIKAKHVVISAGAYSQNLIDQLPEINNKIPRILSGIGSAFVLEHPNQGFRGVVRTPNRAGSCGVHIVPYDEHSVYLGASNYIMTAPGTKPKARYIYYLLQYAIEQINQNFHDAELIELRVGNRPVTVDMFPLVGSTSINGLWILTGTYRDGLHNSPFLAYNIANEILGKSTYTNNKFFPERIPIQTMTKEQAIEEVVEHHISAAYDHSMKLPRVGFDALFREMFYTRVLALYEELDTNFGLPPDLLIMFERLSKKDRAIFRDYYKNIEASINNKFNKQKDYLKHNVNLELT